MNHVNPFSDVGYEIADVRREVSRKADANEVHSVARNVDSLEHSLREARAEIDGLRHRCEALEASFAEMNELLKSFERSPS